MIYRKCPGMADGEYLIAVSSGELGSFIESYLREYIMPIDINGPQTWRTWGKTFRIMRSRDVPKAFTEGRMKYDFGTTGNDVCEDVAMEIRNRGFEVPFVTVKELTDAPEQLKGQLVLYERKNKENMSIDVVRLCTSPYYEQIGNKVLRELISEYNRRGGLMIRDEKIEGYLSSGEAEFGIDTLYSGRTVDAENKANEDQIIVRKAYGRLSSDNRQTGSTYDGFLACLQYDGINDGGGGAH